MKIIKRMITERINIGAYKIETKNGADKLFRNEILLAVADHNDKTIESLPLQADMSTERAARDYFRKYYAALGYKKIAQCSRCGEIFDCPDGYYRTFCEDCRSVHFDEYNRHYYRENIIQRRQEAKNRPPQPEKSKKPTPADINSLARAAHMSYGQYVAKIMMGDSR